MTQHETETTDLSAPDISLEEAGDEGANANAEPGRDLVLFEPKPVELNEPDHVSLVRQLVGSVQKSVGDPDHEIDWAVHGSLALYEALGPADAQESMLARLAVAGTNAAMAASSKVANSAGVPWANEKYSKLFVDHAVLVIKLSEALDRHRGQRQQNVNVHQVNVHSGAQAVVGNVTRSAREGTPDPVSEKKQGPDEDGED